MSTQPPDPKPNAFRVLIVDDSALMRKLIADLIGSAPELDVVGFARDSAEALEAAERLQPDVITLDVEMPGKSGVDILPYLLTAVPHVAVIMVSSHTQEGANVTLTALERGAVDFFPKPDRNQLAIIRESRDVLVSKIIAAAQSKQPRRRSAESRLGHGHVQGQGAAVVEGGSSPRLKRREVKPVESGSELPHFPVSSATIPIIVIGISTGGPQALGHVLPLIPANSPPILIVQHMPATFTAVFAERLNRACQSHMVKEAEDGDKVIAGRILVAPGGRHMEIRGTPSNPRVILTDAPPVSSHRPSIDVLFKSAAKYLGASAVGLIMTGMGRDGVEGCKEILSQGGLTFGQDEASSVVYGMNKLAFSEGTLRAQFALDQFPALIKRFCPDRKSSHDAV